MSSHGTNAQKSLTKQPHTYTVVNVLDVSADEGETRPLSSPTQTTHKSCRLERLSEVTVPTVPRASLGRTCQTPPCFTSRDHVCCLDLIHGFTLSVTVQHVASLMKFYLRVF